MSDRVTVVEVKDRTLWVGLNRPKTLNAMISR